MKTIFKYLATFVVISLISITFMAATHKTENNKKSENPPPCWIQIIVNVDGTCVFINDSSDYIVNLKIYNTCNNPSLLIYDGYNQISSEDGDEIPFCISDTLCTVDIVAQCFKVVTTAVKKNIVTDEIICSGQTILTKNCEGLMNLENDGITVNLN